MMRLALMLLVTLLSGADRPSAQENVEARGITSAIKLEEVVYGHLTELNGKFKLRATEVTFAPNAYLGVHHHVGPGIRYVLSGEVAFTEGGRTTIYKAGEYFFEPGNLGMPVFHTPFGRVACAICYDIWFPEIFRMAAAKGADILCVPTNWVPMPAQPAGLPAMANLLAMGGAKQGS